MELNCGDRRGGRQVRDLTATQWLHSRAWIKCRHYCQLLSPFLLILWKRNKRVSHSRVYSKAKMNWGHNLRILHIKGKCRWIYFICSQEMNNFLSVNAKGKTQRKRVIAFTKHKFLIFFISKKIINIPRGSGFTVVLSHSLSPFSHIPQTPEPKSSVGVLFLSCNLQIIVSPFSLQVPRFVSLVMCLFYSSYRLWGYVPAFFNWNV